MRRTIWKYEVTVTQQPQEIITKKGAILRHVGTVNGELCIWVELDENEFEEEKRMIILVGTGWTIPGGATYLGSTVIAPYVWHVYGKPEDWSINNV